KNSRTTSRALDSCFTLFLPHPPSSGTPSSGLPPGRGSPRLPPARPPAAPAPSPLSPPPHRPPRTSASTPTLRPHLRGPRARLRTTVKEFAASAPGRRAAALAAVWIAATGCDADLTTYDAEDALRTYRLAESELRAELRMTMARAYDNEPHPDTRATMAQMLE